MPKHHNILKKCPDCHQEFTSNIGFLNHVCILKIGTKKAHKKDAVKPDSECQTCNLCNKKFTSTKGYKIHLSHHLNEKKIKFGKDIEISPISSENNKSKAKSPVVKKKVEPTSIETVGKDIEISPISSENNKSKTKSPVVKKKVEPTSIETVVTAVKISRTVRNVPVKTTTHSARNSSLQGKTIPDISAVKKIKLEPSHIDERSAVVPQRKTRAPKVYACSKCSVMSDGLKQYRLHMQTHSEDLNENEPPLSNKNLTNTPTMIRVSSSKRENTPKVPAKPPVSKRKLKTYVCSYCDKICHSLGAYRVHCRMEHTNERLTAVSPSDYISDIIEEETVSFTKTFNSINIPTYENSNITNTLNGTAKLPSDLLNDPEGKHKCPNCAKTFKKIGSFRRHLRSHLNISAYTCKHCLISFFEKHQLVSHAKQMHQGEKKYCCQVCNKKFHWRMGFMQHKIEHISNGPPYSCNLCEACFPSVSRRLVHMANHTAKCPVCQIPIANGGVWHHLCTVHPDVKDCDFSSDTPEDTDSEPDPSIDDFDELDIESDAETYTSMDSDSECQPKPKSKRRHAFKHHVCFICERRFPKLKSLEFHMKSHEIYNCPSCLKFFPHLKQLEEHKKQHYQDNTVLYDKMFDALKVSSTQQPLQIPLSNFQSLTTIQQQAPLTTTVPQPLLTTSAQQHPLMATSAQSQPLLTTTDAPFLSSARLESLSTTDLKKWHKYFIHMKKKLKYPLQDCVKQALFVIVEEVRVKMNREQFIAPEIREIWLKIQKDAKSVIDKNDYYRPGD